MFGRYDEMLCAPKRQESGRARKKWWGKGKPGPTPLTLALYFILLPTRNLENPSLCLQHGLHKESMRFITLVINGNAEIEGAARVSPYGNDSVPRKNRPGAGDTIVDNFIMMD